MFQLTLTLREFTCRVPNDRDRNYTSSFLPSEAPLERCLIFSLDSSSTSFNSCMNEWKSLRKGHLSFFLFLLFSNHSFCSCMLISDVHFSLIIKSAIDILELKWIFLVIPNQESGNFFYKRADSKYFRLCALSCSL